MSESPSVTSALNIYSAIAANRRKTILFVGAFVLVVAVVVEAFGVILGLPLVPASIVAGVTAVIAIIASYVAYRSGDSVVLRMSEAKPASRETHLQLFRTVENLCIGAGMPLPRIYVIEDGATNAFATGRDPEHASIAVTTGLLAKLEPLELEGVIAHELSHIRNCDIRLMMMTAVMVGLIAILVDVALRATWYGAGSRGRYRGKGEGKGGAVLLVIAVIALVLAPIIAKLIQLAVSRQREYLADASGALLTRYPPGLAGALEKISTDDDPLDAATKGTEHLYIANPFRHNESRLNSMFSTHPPIEDRIVRLKLMAGELAGAR